MSLVSRHGSLRFPVFPCFFLLFLLSGLADDPSNDEESKNATSSTAHGGSRANILLLTCLGVFVVVLFSFILFKVWEKKRREQHQARLMQLFENDEELEIELGLRL